MTLDLEQKRAERLAWLDVLQVGDQVMLMVSRPLYGDDHVQRWQVQRRTKAQIVLWRSRNDDMEIVRVRAVDGRAVGIYRFGRPTIEPVTAELTIGIKMGEAWRKAQDLGYRLQGAPWYRRRGGRRLT
jgi:hypothetical protein